MNNRPRIDDELCLMSGHFVAAAKMHLDNIRIAEERQDRLDQSRHALSSIICGASALEAVGSEGRALHGLDNSQVVPGSIVDLKPALPILELLRFVPSHLQPSAADAFLLQACAAYHLRNKFVHYDAVWAREWPQQLVRLGVEWNCRDPLHRPLPDRVVATRPVFPHDVLCSGGAKWVLDACMNFLDWWSGAVGKDRWWTGRIVPTRIVVARMSSPDHPAPNPPESEQ